MEDEYSFQLGFSDEETPTSEEIDSTSAIYLVEEPIPQIRGNFLTGELSRERYSWDRMRTRRYESDWVLNIFTYRGRNKLITKENTRIMMMRAHNKALRLIRSNRVPIDKKLKFDANDETAKGRWNTLVDNVLDSNVQSSREISQSRAFNDAFCKRYFEEEPVRRTYYFFIEFLFASMDPDDLCNKLDLQCCKDSNHTIYCDEAWERFKKYVQFEFLETLEITPFRHF